ncbi:DinB family protein [Methylibium rhizosphaerae]|uniref:DinB family protein n=1 Tax=Methylibium rhizosphaerae TaxID=2570323 RepID=UPI00112E6B64|nr:DinB family protein [Methylibium rhizosphaerae]
MTLTLIAQLRTQARANRLINHRLHEAMAPLSEADFHAPRVSFFPSLAETLNHVLLVDRYYLAALREEADMLAQAERFRPAAMLAELAARQRAFDEELIAWCDALAEPRLAAEVVIDRGEWKPREQVGHILTHLFMHQHHHRGQVHAMLAGTSIKPPQLDEFLLPSDARFRTIDLAQLGWGESTLFQPHA